MKHNLTALFAALVLAAGPALADPASAPGHNKSAKVCHECGHVTGVNTVEVKGEGNAKGMIAGGLAGALLGRQIGHGNGRDLATVAGAAGGAYAGKKIQENMNTKTVWQVHVKYDDGKTATYTFNEKPAFLKGDRIRKHGGGIERDAG